MNKFIIILFITIIGILAYFFAGSIFENKGYSVDNVLNEISVKLDEISIPVLEARNMPKRSLSFRFILVVEKGHEEFVISQKPKIQDALFRYLFNVYQYDIDSILKNRKQLRKHVNKVVLKIFPSNVIKDVKIKYVNEKKH